MALSGAIYAQHQSFADSQSGTGMMVIGLASIIIGMAFIKKRSDSLSIISSYDRCIYFIVEFSL